MSRSALILAAEPSLTAQISRVLREAGVKVRIVADMEKAAPVCAKLRPRVIVLGADSAPIAVAESVRQLRLEALLPGLPG